MLYISRQQTHKPSQQIGFEARTEILHFAIKSPIERHRLSQMEGEIWNSPAKKDDLPRLNVTGKVLDWTQQSEDQASSIKRHPIDISLKKFFSFVTILLTTLARIARWTSFNNINHSAASI